MTTIPANLLQFAGRLPPKPPEPELHTQDQPMPADRDTPPGNTRPMRLYCSVTTPDHLRGMTALHRGKELLGMPGNELPLVARALAAHHCNQLGACMEVMLTAFTVYAQIFEGLTEDDEAYQVDASSLQFLLDGGYLLPSELLMTAAGQQASEWLACALREQNGGQRELWAGLGEIPEVLDDYLEHIGDLMMITAARVLFTAACLTTTGHNFIPATHRDWLPGGEACRWFATWYDSHDISLMLRVENEILNREAVTGPGELKIGGAALTVSLGTKASSAPKPSPVADTHPNDDELSRQATQQVADYLNDVYRADPTAIRFLLTHFTPANQALVDHPHAVVARAAGQEALGVLGLLNGALTTIGLKKVATNWSDTTNDRGEHDFLGFVVAP